jgi:lysozyme
VPNPASAKAFDRYAYVENNPVRYSDPSGRRSCRASDTSILINSSTTFTDLQCWEKTGTVVDYADKMAVSGSGIEFIKQFETLRLDYYPDGGWDKLGNPLGDCTVGWGHWVHGGACTSEELTITPEQADAYLMVDLAIAEAVIKQHVGVELAQNEYDALVSLAFNAGGAPFSGSDLVNALNKGDYPLVAHLFGQWTVDQSGQNSLGLIRRRDYEAYLFKTGNYLMDFAAAEVTWSYRLRIPSIRYRPGMDYDNWADLTWRLTAMITVHALQEKDFRQDEKIIVFVLLSFAVLVALFLSNKGSADAPVYVRQGRLCPNV